jgi:hypothetical protein
VDGFNQSGNSAQANPNKTKQKSLDFLGFIRPNRDFSMGYGQKNKKNRLASQVVCETSQAPSHFFLARSRQRRAGRGFDPEHSKTVSLTSILCKTMLVRLAFRPSGTPFLVIPAQAGNLETG